MLKKVFHIAMVVGNLDRASDFWRDVMGAEITGRETVPEHKVEIAFVQFDNGTNLELLAPTDDNSSVARFLAEHGPGIHHICFEVDNLAARLDHLAEHGVKLIDRTPRRGADGCQIAFLHPSSTLGALIELSERSRPEK